MKSLRSALIVGAAALLIAIGDWEAWGFKGYYTGLRFLICGISAFGAYVCLRERSTLAAPFLLVGILYNPFIKAQADRTFWVAADVIVALGFLAVVRMAPRLDAARVFNFPMLDPPSTPESQTAEISS